MITAKSLWGVCVDDMDHDEASASAAAINKAAAKKSSPKEGIIPNLVIREA